jgi:hypothetical protein
LKRSNKETNWNYIDLRESFTKVIGDKFCEVFAMDSTGSG